MDIRLVSPTYWSIAEFVDLGLEDVLDLASRASSSLTTHRLLVGRLLEALDRLEIRRHRGYSNAVHYARAALRITKSEARESIRVACALEHLPKIGRMAEEGTIAWSMLREIVRKATVETEDFWIAQCAKRTYKDIETLVANTEKGRLPTIGDDGDSGGERSELRCTLDQVTLAIIDQGLSAVSVEFGRVVPLSEALEHLFAEKLAKKPLDEATLKKIRGEARRGVVAANSRLQNLVNDAREDARAMGMEDLEEEESVEGGGERDGSGQYGQQGDERDARPGDQRDARQGEQRGAQQGEQQGERGDEQPGAEQAEPDSPGCVRASDELVRVTSLGDGTHSLRPTTMNLNPNLNPNSDADADAELDDALSLALGLRTGGGPKPGTAHSESELAGGAHLGSATPMIQKSGGYLEGWQNGRLRFNPRARVVTPAQRTELLNRCGHSCSTPGCANHVWLEIHHRKAYSLGGLTTRWNLVALCTRCHKNVHDGHLVITVCPNRGVLVFTDAQGRRLDRHPPLVRAAWLDYWLGWSGHQLESRWNRLATPEELARLAAAA